MWKLLEDIRDEMFASNVNLESKYWSFIEKQFWNVSWWNSKVVSQTSLLASCILIIMDIYVELFKLEKQKKVIW